MSRQAVKSSLEKSQAEARERAAAGEPQEVKEHSRLQSLLLQRMREIKASRAQEVEPPKPLGTKKQEEEEERQRVNREAMAKKHEEERKKVREGETSSLASVFVKRCFV